MRPTRVVDTTGFGGDIRAVRGGLQIDNRRIPLEEVAVVLLGGDVTITGGALSLLAKYDVVVLNCDWRGVPNLVGYAWSDNSRIARRHRMQAEISEPRRKRAWQDIVKAKVRGQQSNLMALGHPTAQRLGVLAKEVRTGDAGNCEAQAARAYWEALFEGNDFLRIPGADDEINGLLNYGYTILRGFVIRAIAAAGLNPSYGIWHRNRSNTFVLADDLIEPYRPAVDIAVHRLLRTTDPEDSRQRRHALVAVTSEQMGGSGLSVGSSMYEFASSLAIYIEGERDRLVPPQWNCPERDLMDG